MFCVRAMHTHTWRPDNKCHVLNQHRKPIRTVHTKNEIEKNIHWGNLFHFECAPKRSLFRCTVRSSAIFFLSVPLSVGDTLLNELVYPQITVSQFHFPASIVLILLFFFYSIIALFIFIFITWFIVIIHSAGLFGYERLLELCFFIISRETKWKTKYNNNRSNRHPVQMRAEPNRWMVLRYTLVFHPLPKSCP